MLSECYLTLTVRPARELRGTIAGLCNLSCLKIMRRREASRDDVCRAGSYAVVRLYYNGRTTKMVYDPRCENIDLGTLAIA